MTNPTNPELLGRVDVSDHRPLLGAGAADHEAAFSAMVPALGHGELVRAAHADGGRLIGDPCDGEGR